MAAIGFRVSPTGIFYSIVENKENHYEIISIGNLKIPTSLDLPNQLNYIRTTLSTILVQYGISFAGIKLMEGNARGTINNGLRFRLNIEGVILELFSNSKIESYILGVTSNIASTLKIDKENPQVMLDKLIDLKDKKTDENKKITSEYKDSMIVALAALELGKIND